MVQVHRVTLLIVDHDELGAAAVRNVLETARYPNHCIVPNVLALETRAVEWSDDHPLNQKRTQTAEVERLFRPAGVIDPRCDHIKFDRAATTGVRKINGLLVSFCAACISQLDGSLAEQQPQEQRGAADQQGGPEDPHRGA
jgi:hypothetical protein